MLRCVLCATIPLLCLWSAGAAEPVQATFPLIAPVGQYVETVPAEFDEIPSHRASVLRKFADVIADNIQRDGKSRLNFICTHNSRRSHFSQVWAQTAASYFGIQQVETYSGGTAATACNPRTIGALRRAGFKIRRTTDGTNPHYQIRYSDRAVPLEAFSKVYSDPNSGNPSKAFIAAMCCSRADRECPLVQGATARIPLHYDDPKVADGTPGESAKYDERCRQIAVEMFFVMNLVAQKTRS